MTELTKQTEQLGDLIYKTLKEDNVTTNIRDRAYITDLLSKTIIKAGYQLFSPPVRVLRQSISVRSG